MAELRVGAEEAGVWESGQQLQPGIPEAGVKHARAELLTPKQRRRHSLLSQAIAAEVIPRLMLTRRGTDQATHLQHALPNERVLELVQLVLGDDDVAPAQFVQNLIDGGLPVDTICLDLLAPAARYLGDLWIADITDFSTVTLAAWQLQRILRTVVEEFDTTAARRRDGASILLVPVFGEQHTLGLQMVAAFFHRAGWLVTCLPLEHREDLVGMVRSQRFGVVGLSLAGETFLNAATSCVRAVRSASMNRNVGVMVGGPIFNEHPELVAQLGADMTATDARAAPVQAQQLLSAARQA